MPDSDRPSIVGIIAAAGQGTRLGPLPCSKELMPVGAHAPGTALAGRPKVVAEYLLDQMRDAGAHRVFFVVRPGKFDIPTYFGDGARLGVSLAYTMMGEPFGTPFSIRQALPFCPDALVLTGFPDILLQPRSACTALVDRLQATGADVVLGLFDLPADGPPIDWVETTPEGRLRQLVPKEQAAPRRGAEGAERGYLLAAWTPRFSQYLMTITAAWGEGARAQMSGPAPGPMPEWPLGAVLAQAIADGLHVDSVHFPGRRYLDIGSPAGWAAARDFAATLG